MAIAYLASALRRNGHDAVLLDGMLEDWTDEETVNRILNERSDAVGFTTVLQKFPTNLGKITALLYDSGFRGPIVVGGHAVSFFARSILEQVPTIDGVVRGEGEQTIVAIADALATGRDWRDAPGVAFRRNDQVIEQPVRRIRNLDELGNPARDLTADVIRRDGLVAVSTSRGCHARCSFCSVPRFYGLENGRRLAAGDWLARDPEGCAREIASLHDRFGLREILVVDDEFFGGGQEGRARANVFARELSALNLPVSFAMSCRAENAVPELIEPLARAGLAHVFIGLEAGSGADLKLYGKGHSVEQNVAAVRTVKSLGLSFQPGFMLFNYRSTLDTVQLGLDFLKEIGELKPTTINSAVDPHYGAPLTADMRRQGQLNEGALEMTSSYLDPGVAIVKAVASISAEKFISFMNFIATAQSAITYEWRRRPPARTDETQRVLDAFEESANRMLSQPVLRSLRLIRHGGKTPGEILTEAIVEIDEAVDDLKVKQSLVAIYLQQREGGIRYVSQLDLIDRYNTSNARQEVDGGRFNLV
ncbi:radical SAM superfamily enzyme YgiQ (UPF0313 family) [Rhizobium lentis]|uniref:Radical SAM superfamily enzyme YgiQ (UPF0313 family) n=1 Tax=Rhizobium lentis TaxID=1138194 RepID=A0A7W8XKD5_9HYPH|nr:radical SAM superfamily enzyme YgiQ (UPF0313 family) [Rhizobium lentis]MBB5553966.1 radical SAM superfamily enzyme YgiQ (UPF0313 family) [Rhizobium lentis]MBB5564528.1 radical SAM superfamily enzyme YgiQ (UPF0313 family) [Rhizobium lentis]MBB5571044.1 radical SAM superfamily enzyme YgiQ (UPF0313 family) [Rhizobium lentis]